MSKTLRAANWVALVLIAISFMPGLDDAFQLTPGGSVPVEINTPRRLRPEKVARLDWHNDLSKLFLDINEAVGGAADERGRAAVIRRMRRALEDTDV